MRELVILAVVLLAVVGALAVIGQVRLFFWRRSRANRHGGC